MKIFFYTTYTGDPLKLLTNFHKTQDTESDLNFLLKSLILCKSAEQMKY